MPFGKSNSEREVASNLGNFFMGTSSREDMAENVAVRWVCKKDFVFCCKFDKIYEHVSKKGFSNRLSFLCNFSVFTSLFILLEKLPYECIVLDIHRQIKIIPLYGERKMYVSTSFL